ncbi:hypothetical protein [Paenibacillus xylanexedens]|uniref:hypothetical protein n=1 Tax=Paenibacillus xylanexedens TaxID=528191 RepID=UPI0011A9E973|nr:hypothetical protein [Paenibacillus xylanexedens]
MCERVRVKVKVVPTKEEMGVLQESSDEYMGVVNRVVGEMVEEKKMWKKRRKEVCGDVVSVV